MTRKGSLCRPTFYLAPAKVEPQFSQETLRGRVSLNVPQVPHSPVPCSAAFSFGSYYLRVSTLLIDSIFERQQESEKDLLLHASCCSSEGGRAAW